MNNPYINQLIKVKVNLFDELTTLVVIATAKYVILGQYLSWHFKDSIKATAD